MSLAYASATLTLPTTRQSIQQSCQVYHDQPPTQTESDSNMIAQWRREDKEQVGQNGANLTDDQDGAAAKTVTELAQPGCCHKLSCVISSNYEHCLNRRGSKLLLSIDWQHWQNSGCPDRIRQDYEKSDCDTFLIH